MCCNAKLSDTQKFLDKYNYDPNKVTTVYKIVSKRDDIYSSYDIKDSTLCGPFQSSFTYKPGLIESKSNEQRITYDKSITDGIHVFLTLKSAQKYVKAKANPHYRIVKMLAKLDDLIGVGTFLTHYNDNAVFRKVYFPNKEYIRIFTEKKKKK